MALNGCRAIPTDPWEGDFEMWIRHRVVGFVVLALLSSGLALPAAVADPVPAPSPTETPTQDDSTASDDTPSASDTAGPALTMPADESPSEPETTPTVDTKPADETEPSDTPSLADDIGSPSPVIPSDTTSPGDGDVVDASGLLVIVEPESVPSDVLDVYAAALAVARNNPSDFGYPQVVDGSVVLPGVSDIAVSLSKTDRKAQVTLLRQYAKSQRRANKSKPAPDYDPDDALVEQIQVQAVNTRPSAAQLDVINDGVFDLRLDPAFKSAGIVETGIDASGRVVMIVHKLTPGLAQRIVKLYGTRDVVVQEDPNLNPRLSFSRYYDNSPYIGGARIIVPVYNQNVNVGGGECTSGFAWQIDSEPYMLTAGHCAPNGGAIGVSVQGQLSGTKIGEVATDGTMDTWTIGTGTVALPGQAVMHGDLALVKMTDGNKVWSKMYRGDPTSSQYTAVTEMWSRPSAIGDEFCTGGWKTGEICDWTVDLINSNIKTTTTHQGVTYEETTRNGTRGYRYGPGAVEGDSGGPVFTVTDGYIAAKGIINAAGTATVLGITRSTVVFTDIWQAFDAFPGSLMDAAVSGDPFGNLETVTSGVGAVSVSGWAIDPDQPRTPPGITVCLGGPAGQGESHYIGLANLGRSDVESKLANWDPGPYHGFSATIPTSLSGTQPVYVYISNALGSKGGNSVMGPSYVTITPLAPTLPMLELTLSTDMTSDGRGEILAIDTMGKLLMYAGTMNGQLSSPVLLGTGFSQKQLFGPGDVNSDGRADVFTIDGSGDLWLYPGNGWYSLGAAVKVGNGWTGWQLVASGDLNGDGKPDLLGIDANGNLFMYAGKGDGTFAMKKQVGNGWTGWSLYAAGDLNGDKKMDILGIDPNGDLYQYAGKGDGTFYAKVQAGNGWLGYTLAAGADLTGDGLADIIGRANWPWALFFYRGLGNAKFAMKVQIAIGW